MSELITKNREIVIPPDARDLVLACGDLHIAAQETNTSYLVVGSVANVCAIGEFYRIPADVDSWYDIRHSDDMITALKQQGYKYTVIEADANPFPYPLEHFEKGNSVIELRGADFTPRGIEYPIRIPILGVSAERRPTCKLVYTPSLAEPQQSKLGNTSILTASREALWFGLNTSLPLIQVSGVKVDKRMQDLEVLSRDLDKNKIAAILAEQPGVYIGDRAIVTPQNQTLLKILLRGIELRKNLLRSRI